ncbi:MAG: 4Fe-4S binding protein [Lentimicrobium sp.]|nr:4Fe-4S binding protein [Lentimicrobium sp.]
MRKLFWLRIVRICISLLFLLLTGIIFLDPAQWIPAWVTQAVTWAQFTPSLIKFMHNTAWIATGFIVFLVLTLLFGRLYCSSVCPIGTLQDIINWLQRKISKPKTLKYALANNILRYAILALTVIFFIAGSSLLVNLLDPYSNFGRIMNNLARPAILTGGNRLAFVLEKNDIFWMPKTILNHHALSIIFSGSFLLLIGWMSATRGRLYCNTICPVGALLGLASKFSLFKISINKASCNSCGRCAKVCKAQCIDVKTKEIDYSRCVSCYNCLDSCPDDGVLFNLNNKIKKSNHALAGSHDRRTMIKAFMLIATFVSTRAFATRLTGGAKPTNIAEDKKNVASPPGSAGHQHFNDDCTACHLCVSVCPTHVLQPSFLQYGLHGLMQPYMDYHAGFCNFECTLCGDVCPTGAIQKILPEQKKLTQLGVAHFIKENCVVFTDNTDCGACSEHCPTKAVNMIPYKDGLTIPAVDDKICIGCGACEYACPTKPYRAIFVEGNLLHTLADEPVQEEIIIKETTEDFPF